MKVNANVMRFPHREAARPLIPGGPCRPVCFADEKKFKVLKLVKCKPVMKTLKAGPRKGQTVPEEIQVCLQIREVHGHGITYRATSRATSILATPAIGKAFRMTMRQFIDAARRQFGDEAPRAIIHLASASAALSDANNAAHR